MQRETLRNIAIGSGVGLLASAAIIGVSLAAEPSTFHLGGSLFLDGSNDAVTSGGAGACQGYGGYSDLTEGAPVTVRSPENTILAVGELTRSRLQPAGTYSDAVCWFLISVPEVPDGEKFYQVEVSRRGSITLTPEQARNGEASLTLGGE